MNGSALGTYSLFLTITLWGILLGGIAYSHMVFLPVYLSDLPNSAAVVNGKYAISEAPFWMTIHPMLISSLIASLIFNRKFKARRNLIALSFAIYIAVLIATAVYFVPELMAFATSNESDLAASDWSARGHRWQTLSLIRGAFCFSGFLPLLIANTKTTGGLQENKSPR